MGYSPCSLRTSSIPNRVFTSGSMLIETQHWHQQCMTISIHAAAQHVLVGPKRTSGAVQVRQARRLTTLHLCRACSPHQATKNVNSRQSIGKQSCKTSHVRCGWANSQQRQSAAAWPWGPYGSHTAEAVGPAGLPPLQGPPHPALTSQPWRPLAAQAAATGWLGHLLLARQPRSPPPAPAQRRAHCATGLVLLMCNKMLTHAEPVQAYGAKCACCRPALGRACLGTCKCSSRLSHKHGPWARARARAGEGVR